MSQILAHSTESPQEAEELSARLRAAGVEIEVRERALGALASVLDTTRRTWEIWVPDGAQDAARKVIDEESKALEAVRSELDAELEAEAVASAAPEVEKPPEPKPVPVVTNNARLAGTLMIAGVFINIAHHVWWFVLSADYAPWSFEVFLRYGITLMVAVSLRGGSRGAWKLSVAWTVLEGLYYVIATLASPPIVPILETSATLAMLLLLLGADSSLRRKLAVALWAVTIAFVFFPLLLAPASLTKDPLVGQWRHQHYNHDIIAFCPDGRFIENAGESQWKRVDLHVVSLTSDAKGIERHMYWAFREHLTFKGARWLPDSGPSLCGAGERH